MMDFLLIAFKASAVYLFIIFAIRLFGKRELTQLSVLDLVFILLISNSVQNAMVGEDSSLLGGIVAAGALFTLNFFLGDLFLRSKKISEFFQGDPLMLIYHGKINPEHLKKAGISKEEIEASVREHGVEDVKEVDLAVLETDGNISILSHDFSRKTTRKRRAHKIIARND